MSGRFPRLRRARARARALRAALLGLLALCMTVQGGLAAVGELHDVVAHADQSALHVEHASGQDDAAAAAGDAPADTLHVLLHFAHCCGHAAGLDPPRMGADWSPASGARPLTAMASPALPPQLRPPFRPPIQA